MVYVYIKVMKENERWGLGIGDWGFGVWGWGEGDWGVEIEHKSQTQNPKSPIPINCIYIKY